MATYRLQVTVELCTYMLMELQVGSSVDFCTELLMLVAGMSFHWNLGIWASIKLLSNTLMYGSHFTSNTSVELSSWSAQIETPFPIFSSIVNHDTCVLTKSWRNIIDFLFCVLYVLTNFLTTSAQIKVCCNHMTLQDEINQVIIHELIHAYDDCVTKNMDWRNCAHHACSEVRTKLLC